MHVAREKQSLSGRVRLGAGDDEQVRDAILGNAGTIISFRVGPSDAEILEREFYPEFRGEDFVNLPNHSIYLKIMVEGKVSSPFSAETLETHPSSGAP